MSCLGFLAQKYKMVSTIQGQLPSTSLLLYACHVHSTYKQGIRGDGRALFVAVIILIDESDESCGVFREPQCVWFHKNIPLGI